VQEKKILESPLTSWGVVNLILPDQKSYPSRDVVNTVMNLMVLQNSENVLSSCESMVFEEGICCIELTG